MAVVYGIQFFQAEWRLGGVWHWIRIALLVLAMMAGLPAATVTWSGGGLTNNWSEAANWGGTAPVAGDSLIFANVTRLAPVNDLAANTAFVSITFAATAGDFVLSGNAVTLTGGVAALSSSKASGSVTIGNPLTFSTAAPTITAAAGGSVVVNGALTNGGLLVTVAAAGPVTIGGAITGTGGLTKSGAGILTVSGLSGTAASNYSGTTTVDGGTLTVTNATALTGALFLGGTAGSTNISALNLSAANFTTGALTVRTNSATANTITVGSGFTYTTAGNVTIGTAVSATNTVLNVTGAGSWVVNAPNGQFWLGGYNPAVTNNSNQASLDLSGLAIFTCDLTTGAMLLGRFGDNFTRAGTMTLAATSTISATTLTVGESASGSPITLRLGSSANVIWVDNFNIGTGGRDSGIVQFLGGTGTLQLRNRLGTGRANVNLQTGGANTGYTTTNSLLLAGHAVDLQIGNFIVGGQPRNGAATNTISFDSGTFDATTVRLGERSGGTVTTSAHASSLNIGGGTVIIGTGGLQLATSTATSTSNNTLTSTVTVSGGTVTIANNAGIAAAVRLANNSAAAAATGTTANGIVNVTGGTVTVAGNVTLGAATRPATATLTLNGGSLNVGNAAIGSATALVTCNLQAGTLANVAQVNGGGAVTKSTAGTLILSGTNPWSGATTISAGTLRLGSANALPAVVGGGDLTVTSTLDLGGFSSTMNALAGAGSVTNSLAGGGVLTVGSSNASATFAGVIADGATPVALSKTGTGTQILSGANTYTGATTISAGSLRVTGSTAAGSAVSVAGMLEGNGTVAGTVTVVSGGAIVPGSGGSSIATLTTGTVNGSAGGSYVTDLDGVTPTADLITTTGTANLAGVLLVNSNANAGTTKTYTIVTAGSISGFFTGLSDGALVSGGGRTFQIDYTPTAVTLTDVSNEWDGGGGDDNWSTAANWLNDTVPTAGSHLVFAGTTRLTPVNDLPAGTQFASFSFSPGAGNFIISGNAITLNGGAPTIVNATASGTMTVNLALTMSTAPASILTDAGSTLVLGGALDNGNRDLTAVLAGTVRISGALSGSGGLIKGGTANLILAGANTFAGTTTVNAGALDLEHDAALGAALAGTVVNSGNGSTAGGEVRLNHPTALTVGEPVTIIGEGNSGYIGALRVMQGDHTWSGPVTLGAVGGNRIGVDDADDTGSSSLLLSGGISGGAGEDLTLYAVGAQSSITVAGQPILMNAAAVVYAHGLAGVSQMAVSGNTFAQMLVQQGHTLRLGIDNALPQTVDLVLGTAAANATAASGTLDLFGHHQTVDQLGSGSDVGAVNALGTRRITNSAAATTATLTVGYANGSSTFDGLVEDGAGTVGLTKYGTGVLTLAGATAHTALGTTTVAVGRIHLGKTAGVTSVAGPLAITGGQVSFGANNQIANSSAVTMSGVTSVFNGTGVNAGQFALTETIASLDISGGCFNAATGSFWTITGTASFSGGGNTIFVGNNGASLNVGGLTLINMTATAGATVATNNSFTVYGTNATTVTTLTVGSGGLTLDGSALNLRRGGAGNQGSRLIINGDITTTGTVASSIKEDTNGGTVGTLAVQLSSTAASVIRTITVAAGGADLTVSIPIADGAATPGSIIKSGAGNLTLSAVNTWTGTTTVSQGALLVTGSTAAASAVTVNAGGTLGGTGTVNGTIALNGGTVAPGTGGTTIGNLTLSGAITWGAASAYVVDLNGTGLLADQITHGLPLTINGTLSVASFVNGGVGQVFTILSASSLSGIFTGIPDGTVIPASGRAVRVNYIDAVTDSVILTVMPAPTVTSITPNSGLMTAQVAVDIVGTLFDPTATVTIGGNPATSVVWVSATLIQAVTPAGNQGLADVVVINPDLQAATLPAAYLYIGPVPTVTGVTPPNGPAMSTTAVTITGTDFFAGTPLAVSVGGVPATAVTFVDRNTITATFPVMVTTTTDTTPDVLVTIGDGQQATLANGFIYDLRPVDDTTGAIAGLAYRYHRVGGPLLPDFTPLIPPLYGVRANATINGGNPFEARNDNWSVEFGGYVTVPDDGIYTFYTASDDGSRLYIGTTLVVSNNFAQGVTERSGQIALSAGSHRLRAEFAQGNGGFGMFVRWQGPTVTKADIPDLAFICDPAPAIASITPTSGPQGGGTVVTISGSNFVAGSLVAIDGTLVVSPVVLDENTITATTPGSTTGAKSVLVIGPRSTGAVLAGGFTYVTSPAPTLTAITPASGPAAGGTTVQLTVSNVDVTPTVTFNGIAATAVVRLDATTVQCVTPAMPLTDATADVTVTAVGQSATLANGYTWTLRTPENPTGTQAGLFYSYYRVGGPLLPTFSAQTAFSTGVRATPGFTTNVFEARNDNWSVRYLAYLTVPSDGVYTLYTASDDGSRLYVGSTLVVENNFAQGVTERSGTIGLAAGTHLVAIEFAQGNGGFGLYVRWSGPGLVKADIPASAFTTDTTPVITSLDVTNGPQSGGTVVTITGSGFTSGATVLFGGTAATGVTMSGGGTTLTCTTPSHVVGLVDVRVANPTGTSSTLVGGFTYDPAAGPTITGVTPATGPANGGTAVTISGSNFTAPMTVTIGGQLATNVVVDGSGTSLTALTPAMQSAALIVDVTVTNGAAQSATLVGGFTYTLRVPENPSNTQVGLTYRYHRVGGPLLPTFSTLTPFSIGVRNTPIITPATNPFEVRNDNWSVEYLGYVTVPSDGVYTFFTESDDGSQLLVGSGVVVQNNFAQGMTERSGSIGLAAGTHLMTIRFAQGTGGYGLNVRWQSAAIAKQLIPNTVLSTDATPTLGTVTPNSGSATGGTTITITGTGFTSGSTVLIGGIPATSVMVAGDGLSLTAVTPAQAAGSVAVIVTNGFGLSATLNNGFLCQGPAPAITAVSPQVGPVAGGTTVLIYGSNFTANPVVRFAGVLATNVSLNAGVISARTPAGTQGPVAVTVTNTDGTSGTRSPGFYYQGPMPTITQITPTRGPLAGGTSVTITGTNFTTGGVTVTFDGVAATGVAVTATSITAFTPAGAQGPANVVVTNFDLRTASVANGFIFEGPAPTFTGITPTSGPLVGGTSVTLTGTNFAAGAVVTFDGVAATGVTVQSGTTIVATTPAGIQGPVDVVVTNVDLLAATLTDGYIYLGSPPVISSVNPLVASSNQASPITIGGSGFAVGVQVTIGGVAATVTSVSAIQIIVTMPSGVTPGPAPIVVTNIDLQSTVFNGFIAQGDAPVLLRIDVPHGPVAGGRLMTLTGSEFRAGAIVMMGGVPATNVQVSPSGTTITAMTPAHAEGAVTVTVTNTDLLTSFPLTYTYYTKDDDRTVGNGCGTGGGLAVFLLLAFMAVGGGFGRRR